MGNEADANVRGTSSTSTLMQYIAVVAELTPDLLSLLQFN